MGQYMEEQVLEEAEKLQVDSDDQLQDKLSVHCNHSDLQQFESFLLEKIMKK